MLIQLNTDSNINGTEALAEEVEAAIQGALAKFSQDITRVEVHLSDANSGAKTGPAEMRCLLEARPAGHQPIAVTHEAATLTQALDGAIDKLTRALESLFGRLASR